MEDMLPVLAVRQPWASLIASGIKTIEVRKMNTRKRGWVGIYASRSKPRPNEIEKFMYMPEFVNRGRYLPYGQIIAAVNLSNSFKPTSKAVFNMCSPEHHVSDDYYDSEKTWCWKFNHVKRIEPIDFKFEKGQVVWSKIERDKLQVI